MLSLWCFSMHMTMDLRLESYFLFLHALILGYLIFKSGYFPKILGVLFIIASLGYLIDSFSHVLIRQLQNRPGLSRASDCNCGNCISLVAFD